MSAGPSNKRKMQMSEAGPGNKKPKMAPVGDTRHIFEKTQDFKKIKQKKAFIDHSPFIKVFYEKETKLFVTAPKMFCKSSNMNMLRCFFELKKNGEVEPNWRDRHQFSLFSDLKIVTEGDEEEPREHFCAHPVLHVDFRNPGVIKTYEDAEKKCFVIVQDLFVNYTEVLEANKQKLVKKGLFRTCTQWWEAKSVAEIDVGKGLAKLCECLYYAYDEKPVLVLVDETDAIVTSALRRCDEMNLSDICTMMTEILGNITKGMIDEFLQGVLLTGVSYISGVGYTEEVTAIACRFLDDTALDMFDRSYITPFYGLHENDFNDLAAKVQKELSISDEVMNNRKEEIMRFYNGYHTQEHKKCIYPLYVVVHFLIHGCVLVDYMLVPDIARMYSKFVRHQEIALSVLELVGGGEVCVTSSSTKVYVTDLFQLRENPSPLHSDIYFTLLLELGILTHSKSPEDVGEPSSGIDPSSWNLKIPNTMTSAYFQRMLCKANRENFRSFKMSDMINCAEAFQSLHSLFLVSDDDGFERKLKQFHNNLTSLLSGFNNPNTQHNRDNYSENTLQGILSMAMHSKDIMFPIITTELQIKDELGNVGKLDIWMLDKSHTFAALWECKIDLKAGTEGARKSSLKPVKEKTSGHALLELRGVAKTKKIQYLHELKKCNIRDFFLLGVSMDGLYQPSVSLATSTQENDAKKPFFCISKTEPNIFPKVYPEGICKILS